MYAQHVHRMLDQPRFLRYAYKIALLVRFVFVVWPLPSTLVSSSLENNRDVSYIYAQRALGSINITVSNNPSSTPLYYWLLTYLPLYLVKSAVVHVGVTSLSPWLVLVVCNLPYALLSLQIDRTIFYVAKKWQLQPNAAIFIYCTSYWPLVFFTKADACTLRTLLLALFLTEIVADLSEDYDAHANCCSGRGQGALVSLFAAARIGSVMALGVWHRASFWVLAMSPFVQWLYDGTGKLSCARITVQLVKKIVWFLNGFLLTGFVVSLADSTLTGAISVRNMVLHNTESVLSNVLRNLTVSPHNFMGEIANMSRNTFQIDKVQPVYAHVLFSVPIAFGGFGIACLLYSAQCCTPHVLKNFKHVNPKYWFFVSSFVLPLLLFSLYPKKEVSDIAPLIIPVVFITVIRLATCSSKFKNRMMVLWFFLNFTSVYYFGFLHYGANWPLVQYLSQKQLQYPKAHFEVHFYRSKPPAKFLLNNRVTFREFNLIDTLSNRLMQAQSQKLNSAVYLALPGSTANELCQKLNATKTLKFTLVSTFPKHFSPEAPPSLRKITPREREDEHNRCVLTSHLSGQNPSQVELLMDAMSLKLYRVSNKA